MTTDESSLNELRASRTRIVAAADEERRSIERALHDGPMQHLVALGVNLQLASGLVDADPQRLSALLAELVENVHEALDDVRALAWRVYPSLLLDCGLGDALRTAASMAATPTRVEAAGLGRSSPEIEASIYFCCVELLHEAEGGGHRTTVGVRSEGDAVLFDVTLEGADFEEWATRDLHGLSDRLGAVGGRITLAPAVDGVRISGQASAGGPSSVSAR